MHICERYEEWRNIQSGSAQNDPDQCSLYHYLSKILFQPAKCPFRPITIGDTFPIQSKRVLSNYRQFITFFFALDRKTPRLVTRQSKGQRIGLVGILSFLRVEGVYIAAI